MGASQKHAVIELATGKLDRRIFSDHAIYDEEMEKIASMPISAMFSAVAAGAPCRSSSGKSARGARLSGRLSHFASERLIWLSLLQTAIAGELVASEAKDGQHRHNFGNLGMSA